MPTKCPKCESEHLYFLGAGSQQGEERLQELCPTARIGRMDRDTVRGRSDMERLLARLHGGEINLLVGTQMIAKGHDIHGVTLVGVIGADFALGLPDFRAAERVRSGWPRPLVSRVVQTRRRRRTPQSCGFRGRAPFGRSGRQFRRGSQPIDVESLAVPLPSHPDVRITSGTRRSASRRLVNA